MSDEGREPFTPLDAVELAHGMAGAAAGVWAFFSSLIEEGFNTDQALRLTVTYVHGLAGGKIA